jgi:hypothetical protein
MKLKLYIAMPFSILFLAITVLNWSNLLIIILGNSLCTVAYLSLVAIVKKEKKPEAKNVADMTTWQDTVKKAEFPIEDNSSNTVPT